MKIAEESTEESELLIAQEPIGLPKDAIITNTLNVLVSNGRATLYDLMKSNLGEVEKLKLALKDLKDRQLIAEKPAEIVDFTTYYPTSHGLKAFTDLKIKSSLTDKVKDAIASMSLLVN